MGLALLFTGQMLTFGGSMTYTVTLNPDVCHEVHLGRLTAPKGTLPVIPFDDVSTGYCRPEVRSAGEDKLFVTAGCHGPRNNWIPSQEKYSVDLSAGARTRRISEAEWESATELPWSEGGMYPKLAEDSVAYKGPPLRRSGPKWMGIGAGPPWSHLSRTGARAAVNSWDGFEITYTFLDPTSLFARDKVKGDYWVDIYETNSGRPLIRIQGSFHGAEPSMFLGEAAWYSDRYYVMSVGGTTHGYEFSLRHLLICDADAAIRKGNNVLKERK